MLFARRHHELQSRREHLIARSAELRVRLAQDSQLLLRPLAVVDQMQNAGRWLLGRPGWTLGGMLVVLLFRPRRARSRKPAGLRQGVGFITRWVGRVWWGWRLWQRAQRWLRDGIPG